MQVVTVIICRILNSRWKRLQRICKTEVVFHVEDLLLNSVNANPTQRKSRILIIDDSSETDTLNRLYNLAAKSSESYTVVDIAAVSLHFASDLVISLVAYPVWAACESPHPERLRSARAFESQLSPKHLFARRKQNL